MFSAFPMDMKMICEKVKLLEYVAGETTDAEHQAVRDHLGECTECRERLKIMRLLEMEYSIKAPRTVGWKRWIVPIAAAFILAIGIPLLYQSAKTVAPSLADLATNEAYPYFPLEARSSSGPDEPGEVRRQAVEAYHAGDYAKAALLFAELKPDAESSLLQGVSLYMADDLDKALPCLDPLSREPSQWSAAASWYLANLQVRQGQVEAARNVLRRLAQDNGEYSTEAAQLLEQLAPFKPE